MNIQWFNDNAGFLQVVLVFMLVGITGLYAWQAKRSADEAKATRELQYRPQVVLAAGPPALFRGDPAARTVPVKKEAWKGSSSEIRLDIENVGLGPALDVAVTCYWNGRLYRLPTGIDGMGPGHARRVGLWFDGDSALAVDGLDVTIEFQPVLGDERLRWTRRFTLDELNTRGVEIHDGEAVEAPFRVV